jgi:hypothetical protein
MRSVDETTAGDSIRCPVCRGAELDKEKHDRH